MGMTISTYQRLQEARRHRRHGERSGDVAIGQDETWLHHNNPEAKQKSEQWKHPSCLL